MRVRQPAGMTISLSGADLPASPNGESSLSDDRFTAVEVIARVGNNSTFARISSPFLARKLALLAQCWTGAL